MTLLTEQPKENVTSNLHITDTETQVRTQIEIKDPNDSHKTLGTYQNPPGNPFGQIKVLQLKEDRMRWVFVPSVQSASCLRIYVHEDPSFSPWCHTYEL
jgi:hypothetical protein